MARESGRGRGPVRVRGAVIAALACGLAVTACGGAGTAAIPQAGTATNAANPQALAASECMRAHGIRNFPDPEKGSGGVGLPVSKIPGSSTITVAGITFDTASRTSPIPRSARGAGS